MLKKIKILLIIFCLSFFKSYSVCDELGPLSNCFIEQSLITCGYLSDCECLIDNRDQDPDFENNYGYCIPINTHTWVLYLLGGSLVLVGYVIARKNKV